MLMTLAKLVAGCPVAPGDSHGQPHHPGKDHGVLRPTAVTVRPHGPWRGGSAAIAKRRLTSGEGFESAPVRCTQVVF